MGVRATLLSLLVVVPAVAGCQKAPAAKPADPHPVAVLTATPTEATATHSYTGVVRARYEADLGFRVAGKVSARFVEVGQRVTAGQKLATLDPADYELAAKSAAAELGAAEGEARNAAAELARTERAIASGVASTSELDARRAADTSARERVTKAKRELELASNRLAYCTLAADADGLVIALPAEAGQVVADGQMVARVARRGEREAVVSIPENRLDARQDRPRRGHPLVRRRGPLPGEAPRTLPGRRPDHPHLPGPVHHPGPRPEVALGMTATVHLTAGSGGPAYVLPPSALVRQGSQGSVWVAGDGGKLTLTPVKVARYRHERWSFPEGCAAASGWSGPG